jgi:formamidopyrimidine-DNA glycosylase
MPELPEVETVVRGLRSALSGRRIAAVRCYFAGLLDTDVPCFQDTLRGKTVAEVRRHGKYLFILFEGQGGVAFHLRMTGQALLVPEHQPADRHTHLEILFFGGGQKLAYRDVRKFGRFELLSSGPEAFVRERGFGPDALSIPAVELYARLRGTRRNLKAALLDQRVLAGLGNIYTDEILFRQRLSPLRPSSSLSRRQVESLAACIHEVLAEAIDGKGSSISDFVDAKGERGSFQSLLRVYGRAGEPCPRCGTTLAGSRVAGRSTSYCPRCQRNGTATPGHRHGARSGGRSAMDSSGE